MTRLRDRRAEQDHRRQDASPGDAGGNSLNHLRQEARDILAAGNDAINRVLSRDSSTFLRANRQQGGQ